MNFEKLAEERYSSRRYDSEKQIETDKLKRILTTAAKAPSACNGQPYHITVVSKDMAKKVARVTKDARINSFVEEAPTLFILSEKPYSKMAGIGAKIKKNDYRSMDIGILASYITLKATEEGLGSCIIGWFDSDKIRDICDIDGEVRLIISLGYALDAPTEKRRKSLSELVTYK